MKSRNQMNGSGSINPPLSRTILIAFLYLLTILMGCIPVVKEIDYIPASTITLRDSTGVVRISLYSGDNKVKTDPGAIYWWYDTKVIHRSQGDFSGRLLDGSYIKYGLNGEMLEKGSFSRGLKSGTWLCWYENGLIHTSSDYKDGERFGSYANFNEKGVQMEQGFYENDKLNGKFTRFSDSGIPVLQLLYQNGMIKDTLCADSACLSR